MSGPLEGFRVIDLSQVVAGPYATMLLADQGAEVIKIEPRVLGDLNRISGSFSKGGLNAFTLNNNRGKKSLAIDLTKPAGVEIVRSLMASADVTIQNFRPGVADRLGLGAASLRVLNPRLITVSISGYGPDGPLADRPVFDPIIQALSGHVDVQVNPAIPFPDLVRTVVVDKATALMAAQAITAALLVRERTGEGQHIDISMLDSALAFFWPDGMMRHSLLDDDVTRGRTLYETYSLTPTIDGHLVYFAASEKQFAGLAHALGHAEWLDDPRWAERKDRGKAENFAALGQAIATAFETFTTADIMAKLEEHDVPAGPVVSITDVPRQPQVVHNQSLVEWDHPTAGRVRQALPAARFSDSPTDPWLYSPAHGADTDQVLAEAGHDAAQIAAWREAEIVGPI